MSLHENEIFEESKKEAEEEKTIMESFENLQASVAKLSRQVEELSRRNAHLLQNPLTPKTTPTDDWREQQENNDRGRAEDIERHFTNPLEH